MLLSNTKNVCHNIFSLCSNLTFVDLRAVKGLSYLGKNTFNGFEKLRTVLLWDSLNTIKAGAFEGSGLESFTAPASLKNIDKMAFDNCERLKHVDISACTL